MFMIINTIIMAIIAFYLIWRLITPLKVNLSIKIIYALFIILASEKLLIFRLVHGTLSQQGLSYLLNISTGFIFSFIIVAFMLIVSHDLLYLIYRILTTFLCKTLSFAYAFKNPRQSATIAIITLLLTIFGTWQAIKVPNVNNITLSFKDLPSELNNFKIVHLSDLHIGPGFDYKWLSKIVQKINALEVDAVMITGDIIDGSTIELKQDISPLKQLKSKYGTFLSVGNHEYYHGLEPWIKAFRQMGITVLDNKHKTILINNTTLIIAGLTDPVSTRFNTELPNVKKALENSPAQAFTIMLAHQPKLIQDILNNNVQLVLAGHTHGGLIAPIQWLVALFNKGFVAGVYELDNMYAYINKGAGLWFGLPLRLGVSSEITYITLTN